MNFLRFLQRSPKKRTGFRRTAYRDTQVCESLESRALLAAQMIAASPQTQSVGTNSSVEFDVVYSTADPVDATTSGLTLRMHYNSSELTPDITAITNSAFAGATIQDSEDTSDFDADDTTDRLVNFLWFDIGGNFPAGQSLPLTVFTATFATSASFDGAAVSFTSAPPSGFDFNSTPAQIDLDSGPLAGNVDGDTDFDANDSFLIQLIQLSGTDTQIDQGKGASSLTAGEIRSSVNALQTVGDVDGNGSFDANDGFLIHLIKLSGTNSQIDQSKGSSPLPAAEIRSRVDSLGDGGTPASANSSGNVKLQASTSLFDTTTQAAKPQFVASQDAVAEPLDQLWTTSRSWLDTL